MKVKLCRLGRLVVAVAGVYSFSSLAGAQDIGYTGGSGNYASIYQNQINVTTTIPDTYYSLVANQVGYGGIQMNASTSARVGIFSLWDQGTEESTVYAYNSNLNIQANGRFGGEGTGVQFIWNYPWSYGTNYRSALRAYVEQDGAHVRYSGFFYDAGLGTWTYIVTERGNTGGEALEVSHLWAFAENYGGTYGTRNATMNNAWYYAPGTGWNELTSGSVTNTTQESTDYSEILTSTDGFQFYSNSSITPMTVGTNVSYTPSGEAPIVIPYNLSAGNVSAEGNWEPDGYWTDAAGDTATSSTSLAVNTSLITSPAPQGVYQNLRSGSDFQYNLIGFIPGTSYTVTLQFVEPTATASGQRLENVAINGTPVLSNFDIFKTAGGQYKAVGESFTATADSTGTITIHFTAVSGSMYPAAVSAITATTGSTTGSLANGTYTVTNSSSGLVWDDPGSSMTSGVNVDLYGASGNPNQNWTFTALGGGYYAIVNAYSGLALNDPASSTTSGTLLIQYPYGAGTSNEQWLLTPSGSGYVITNKYSGLAIDPNTNAVDTDIRQEPASGASAQVWRIH
jgi:Domain of unknown function (DUF3472)/Malectin domain/Ricin-type beta-trefoil lectin domain-like